MPHMIIAIARHTLERRMHATPIEINPDLTTADILAPPLSRQATVPTPIGPVSHRMVIRKVTLRGTTGSGACTLVLDVDECSAELLSTGKAVSMLVGRVVVPFNLRFVEEAISPGQHIARLSADFRVSNAGFRFDDASRAKIEQTLGSAAPDILEKEISTNVSLEFRKLGTQATGMAFNVTHGVPSEALETTDSLPTALWVNAETLAISLRYGPSPVPPTFRPVPFISGTSTIGLRVSNDGFQRTLRAQAVRGLAREMLSNRLRDGYVRDAHLARGGQGEVTDADRHAGQIALNDFLDTQEGRARLDAETPRPIGKGELRHQVQMPDPISSFTARIPELDLWLGNGTIEGRARVEGRLHGVGFKADIRFRSRPVLVSGAMPRIEMHDMVVDDPDLRISLPSWLEWTVGILASRLAGLLMGVVVGYLLSSIGGAIAKPLVRDALTSGIPDPESHDLPGLPDGARLTAINVVPEHMEMHGTWRVVVDDPRPHVAAVRIVDDVKRYPVGRPRQGRAYFKCLGALGILADSTEHDGQGFNYAMQTWRSEVRLELVISELPLPITRFPWMVSLEYRSSRMYRLPVASMPQRTIQPPSLTVDGPVWTPEPPMKGTVETRKFTIDVSRHGDDVFTLQVPAAAACLVISLSTQVMDGAGKVWKVWHKVDIQNETVSFGDDFQRFRSKCDSGRKEWQFANTPSVLDRVWYPPDFHLEVIQESIRAANPGALRELGALVEARGIDGVRELLAPSLRLKR